MEEFNENFKSTLMHINSLRLPFKVNGFIINIITTCIFVSCAYNMLSVSQL